MSSVDEFLDLQGRDGRLDSVGAFSIDQAAQLRKLRSAFLTDDTKALLKLVQALVGWGSDTIQIGYCDQELSLYGSSVDLEKIQTALITEAQELLNLRDGPHTDLVIGLSRLLIGNPSRVFFSFWKEGQIERLHHWLGDVAAESSPGDQWLGEEALAKLRRPPEAWKDGLGIHVQFPDTQAKCPFKFDEDEFARRIFYCPCFVYLQRKLLGIKAHRNLEFVWSRSDLFRETFMQEENSDAHWYLEYFTLARPGPNTIWPRPLYNTKTNLSPDIVWTYSKGNYKSLYRMFSWGSQTPQVAQINRSKALRWAGVVSESQSWPLPTCGSAVLVRDFKKRKAVRVYVVKRGVLIEQLALQDNHTIGNASIVLVDDGCPTDLSQFSLQAETTLAEIRDQAKLQLIEALEFCQKDAPAFEKSCDKTAPNWKEYLNMVAWQFNGGILGWLLGSFSSTDPETAAFVSIWLGLAGSGLPFPVMLSQRAKQLRSQDLIQPWIDSLRST